MDMTMQEKTENERFFLLQKQSPFMFWGSILGGLGLVATLWGVVSHQVLLSWYVILVIYWLLRLRHSIRQCRELSYRLPTVNEKKYFYLYPITSGIFWGTAGALFYTPESMLHLVYLLMYLFGLVVGGSVSLAYVRWAFPLYAIITATPIAVLLVIDENKSFLWIAFTLVFSLLVVIAISRNVYHSISESLKIRFKNEDLVKQLQQQAIELKAQTEAAIKANEDKSRFLASASHDLRQPIHSLSLLTDALSSQVTTKTGQSILALVHSANDSLNSLLGSLLDISKLDAGIVEPQIERIALSPLLSRVVDNYRLLAEQKDLQLRLRVSDCYVDSDASLLSNAIMNLIDNAIKYTSTGGVLVAVRIHRKNIKIQIWDTGLGIDSADHEKIYDEFLQLGNSARDAEKGLGLGLSISKRLLQLLGHPLSLSSKPGRGSVFTISMPLSTLPEEVALNRATPIVYNLDETSKHTVLLVDDNVMVRESTTLALESWGYKVISALSIEVVEDIATSKEASKISIIAADYRLQDSVTGIDAIKRFKQLSGCDIPAFLITGDTAPVRLQEAASFGLPLLHKPLKQGEFKAVLHRLIH
ncbi:MAG TPA: hybrid sensor histidine kinase/response regulator [Leucothrix mucor]|nr:hybrid sensor histidine kinase/response regulator [Leucothrix mucor]